VSPITPCLSWRTTCSGKSTFDRSAVYLKQNGKYCGLKSKGIRNVKFTCDQALHNRARFQIEHSNSDKTCKTAKLIAILDQAWNCEPLDGMLVGRMSRQDISLQVLSNPDAIGQTGKITLGARESMIGVKERTQDGSFGGNRWVASCGKDLFRKLAKLKNGQYGAHCLKFPDGFGTFDDPTKVSSECIAARTDGWCYCPHNKVMTGLEFLTAHMVRGGFSLTGYTINILCTKLTSKLEIESRSWGETKGHTPGTVLPFGCPKGEAMLGLKVWSDTDWYRDGGNYPTHWRARCGKLRPSLGAAKFDVEFAYAS